MGRSKGCVQPYKTNTTAKVEGSKNQKQKERVHFGAGLKIVVLYMSVDGLKVSGWSPQKLTGVAHHVVGCGGANKMTYIAYTA